MNGAHTTECGGILDLVLIILSTDVMFLPAQSGHGIDLSALPVTSRNIHVPDWHIYIYGGILTKSVPF